MQLSVIIVNYNVKYFVEHCVLSVLHACKNIEAEIIVVDNNSKDGSIELLQEKYPQVRLIANTQNTGFAVANNQAVQLATGKYILFLNPDTIVPEDCFAKCIAYMEAHPTCGALGTHLIDGKGNFLPESKRGFPDTKTAFYKISGLSSLFKKSTIFNKYHLGYLPENQTNKVDVLVGCFMLMPKKLIDQIGSFDEDYFMYGEDIDLSYRVQKAGYDNVYFADTSVIHYKGESTKKGSLNYVKMFYNAMIIFAKKHLSGAIQNTFIPLIKIAIFVRASLSIGNKIFKTFLLPLLDATIMLLSLWQVKIYWASHVKQNTFYKPQMLLVFFTFYILTWVLSIFLNGGYDQPLKKIKIARGMLVGSLITLAVYGLLPESVRFSRAITLISASVSLAFIILLRFILQKLNVQSVQPNNIKSKSIVVVGAENDCAEINLLLKEAGIDKDIIGNIYHSQLPNPTASNYLGGIEDLKNIANLYNIGEIIFAQNQLTFATIIDTIKKCGNKFNYKIHSTGTSSIIGSNSKNTAGDLYAADWHFNISSAAGIRSKRTFDIISSLLILLFCPIGLLFYKNKIQTLQQAVQVLFNKKTWIGYNPKANIHFLPTLKPAVFCIGNNYVVTPNNAKQLNILYARNYTSQTDFTELIKEIF